MYRYGGIYADLDFECLKPFNELLEKERIRRSTQLVLGTQLPLADISELLGFSESSAFSKAFKRWHGESPQIFRQRNIQNNTAF